MKPGEGSKLSGMQIGSAFRSRKRFQMAMLATAGIGAVAWILYMVEPFASKMEPYTYRGQKVPTVPKSGAEAVTTPVHPSSAKESPHSGTVRGEVEGKRVKSPSGV